MNFRFVRPKSHYGTGRNAKKLKPSAPPHHTQKPDATKLLRIFTGTKLIEAPRLNKLGLQVGRIVAAELAHRARRMVRSDEDDAVPVRRPV